MSGWLLLFWKDAWLKPVNPDVAATSETAKGESTQPNPGEDGKSGVWKTYTEEADGTIKYRCQATRLPDMTKSLEWWDLRQYLEDYLSGNVGMWAIFKGFIYSMYYNLSQAGIGLGKPMRWLYDLLSPLWGGPKFPRHSGKIPEGQPTPAASLNLQPGELVRVKAHSEVLCTLNTNSVNRGMHWDAELVPFCGETHRVLKRVNKIIDERSGKMLDMKTPCIILDNVVCQARYSGHRMFCPRGIYPYWREIWLERAESEASKESTGAR